MDTAVALKEVERRIRQRKLLSYQPYPFQKEFHNAGATNAERLLCAANGVGKTMPGAAETAMHLTGEYPDWWEGKRFDGPVLFWVGSISNQTQREYTQPALLGDDLGENLGTGFIPKRAIVGKVRIRQAGMADVADVVTVRHKSGGVSRMLMKTYEQGWRAWQGAAPDGIWMDEQHDENAVNEKMIFSEVQTRIFRSGGIVYLTLTPLLGETPTISHFMNPKAPGIWWIGATWDDAPHLGEEDKARLRASYPDHELEVRTKGVPMMGEGRVFTVSEDDIKTPPFDIPGHYARLKGVDFGIDHPAAVVDIAWDRDADIMYVTRVWRKSGAESEEHAEAINEVDPWVPVAWPHDGHDREKGSGQQLKDIYVTHGVRMLSKSARYKSDKGGGQPVEPIVDDINQRARNGGLKVFSNCKEFFEEWRNLHRKEGKIVPLRDDVMKAFFYAAMMKRYAIPRSMRSIPRVPQSPVASVR